MDFGEILQGVLGLIACIYIITRCCRTDSDSSTNTTRNTTAKRTTTYNQLDASYYNTCPSCGAPYYEDYCEKCGYSEVNQGWVGEHYGKH